MGLPAVCLAPWPVDPPCDLELPYEVTGGDTAPAVRRDITLRYKETRRQKQQSHCDQGTAVGHMHGPLPGPEDPEVTGAVPGQETLAPN